MLPNVFLDLDGVMADLEGFYLHHFGHKMDEAKSRSAMWQRIHKSGRFFADVFVMDGAKPFYTHLLGLAPYYDRLSILTSCPSSKYAEVAGHKLEWVRRELGEVFFLPVNDSSAKQLFIQKPGDILIDDWGKNCREWEAAGGVAIKHEGNDFTSTLSKLIEVLNADIANKRRRA